ncbi:protein translocase subunit SecD [Sphingomonas glacialis]|uniref:Protein translocase subunit SecD n=1 Tax=Sphingomonas glacialis TaxID=658225 RepID=A0A502G037_9SPHN|nr:protein translocase subunit SecD [Sphingomonas glacialis]TPG55125.1 protein translocase subunit SecD [Sphingomonas glacialis]
MLDFPRWKVVSILGFLACLMALAVPSFLPDSVTSKWGGFPHPKVNLGLDLAGGSYMLIEADTDELVKNRLEAMREQIITEMAKGPPISIGDIATDGGKLSFLLRDVTQLDAARERLNKLTGGVGYTGQRDWDLQVIDSSRVVMTPTQAGIAAAINTAMATATDVVRTRIDKLGTKEPTIVRQGNDRIVVQVPGLKDPKALRELLGKTAKLEFKMVDDTPYVPGGIVPAGSQALPYSEAGPGAQILVKRQAILTGDQLLTASQGFKQDTNEPIVNFGFNSEGGKKFARITQEQTGKRFAVIVDDKVISAPRINTPILGGSGYIEGSFTVESANNLSIALSSGKLPISLKVVEERTVGPDLGADSIHAGILASGIAVTLVVLFMIATYGRFGFYADYAVVINVMVIMGVLALLNGTLTLPGIAGFVLTIGTAVDANVLINERIREERRRGRSVIQSVELGYKEASRTIFEANATHAISGLIMLMLGSGPVKGFAVVLLIGIATSVFTAVTFTRMLVVLWIRKNRPTEINI